MKKYQNHFEHWDKDKYYFSALYYTVKIEVYEKCEVITI